MIETKQDFNIRKNEIDILFTFLEDIDDDNTFMQLKNSKNQISTKYFSSDLQKILISNGFVMLYNLIESTIRNSLTELFDIIRNENITYKELSENMRVLWIKQCNDNLKEGTFSNEKLQNQTKKIISNIIEEEIIELDKNKMNFSGNLDARKIKAIAEEYGFEIPSKNGEKLHHIMNKRNHLAHGNFSFLSIGKDFSIQEIKVYKNETFVFLEDVIKKIEIFVNKKDFKFCFK